MQACNNPPSKAEQAQKRVLRLREVCARYGLSKTSVYRLMEQGEFPQPVRLGPRAVGWRVEDLEAWLENRSTQD
ncbi:MAG TPA: AlpA family transcriptional regulator [Gammaproteobacteria bacterium]|nr:AlpA family transcriptional regulator [Gammaproteobacteria bacterium]